MCVWLWPFNSFGTCLYPCLKLISRHYFPSAQKDTWKGLIRACYIIYSWNWQPYCICHILNWQKHRHIIITVVFHIHIPSSYKSRFKLAATAVSSLSISSLVSSPIYSFNLVLSMIRICSSRIREVHLRQGFSPNLILEFCFRVFLYIRSQLKMYWFHQYRKSSCRCNHE